VLYRLLVYSPLSCYHVISVRTIQGKVDRTDPVLISLCSTVVQYRSSTTHAESAERPVCQQLVDNYRTRSTLSVAAVCATGSRPTQFTVVVPCMSWSHVNWPARTQCTRLFTFVDGRNKRLYDCLWSVDNKSTAVKCHPSLSAKNT